MTPVEGQANTFDLERADNPFEEGTALNKRNLLPDSVAEALGLDPADDPVPADAFRAIAEGVDPIIEAINVNESETVISVALSFAGGQSQMVTVDFDSSGKPTKMTVDGAEVPITWKEASA